MAWAADGPLCIDMFLLRAIISQPWGILSLVLLIFMLLVQNINSAKKNLGDDDISHQTQVSKSSLPFFISRKKTTMIRLFSTIQRYDAVTGVGVMIRLFEDSSCHP